MKQRSLLAGKIVTSARNRRRATKRSSAKRSNDASMTLELTDELLDRDDRLIVRESGPPDAPPILYFPGVHGDWTPFGAARELLATELRVVEVTYPRALGWRLDDFASAAIEAMDRLGLADAHVLGESFGSLIGWRLALDRPERVRSFILAGGFCRPPRPPVVLALRGGMPLLPAPLFDLGIDGYIHLRHFMNGRRADLADPKRCFPAARSRRGLLAIARRLAVIQSTDLRDRLAAMRRPTLYLGGSRDVVVPVRREIRELRARLSPECSLEARLLAGAPHPILPARPRAACELILDWIRRREAP
jgi:pimeloyl-ACP methyl ester carboxylesterase